MKKYSKPSEEQIELGHYLHTTTTTPILKLTCTNIPYPNSPVIYNNHIIGNIDEIFGTLNDNYCSVILEKDDKIMFKENESVFYAFKDKFIYKNKLLPRKEVELEKERKDKSNNTNGYKFKSNRVYGDGKRDRMNDGRMGSRGNGDRMSNRTNEKFRGYRSNDDNKFSGNDKRYGGDMKRNQGSDIKRNNGSNKRVRRS